MKRKSIKIFGIVLFVAALTTLAIRFASVGSNTDHREVRASIALAEAMGGDTTGFERAIDVQNIEFPSAFGAHPGFKTEWWYYTGNLSADDGRHFGYELTIFRHAIAPPDTLAASRTSDWSTNQLYMAHFSLADVLEEDYYAFERFSRGAVGLAGANGNPYRVWLEDWSVEAPEGYPFPMRIQAAEGDVAIDLVLETTKPMVLQGDRGLDKKGGVDGNASYYYSFTRLRTEGTIDIGDTSYTVNGFSWKDHEWSTSALGADQVGWDWFALQMSDGRDLMFYQLRQRDGSASPHTSGVIVGNDGSTRTLALDDVTLTVLDTWTSTRSGAVYPAGWRLKVPEQGIDLRITPLISDQELDVSVRYWEGAVEIEGATSGDTLSGFGYVELTGYGDDGTPR